MNGGHDSFIMIAFYDLLYSVDSRKQLCVVGWNDVLLCLLVLYILKRHMASYR